MIPNLSCMDGGIERRIKIIEFPFQFKAQGDFIPDHPTIRLRDISLQDKFKQLEYYREFLFLLIDTYREIKDWSELKQPSSHAKRTTEFFFDNSPIDQFLDQYIEITGDHLHDVIHTRELLELYNQEYKSKLMGDKYFKKELI